jgi:hypothetical protein
VDSGRQAYPLPVAIDASKLRHGRVRGRYFRENFAQAGIDLSQIIPELVTNADAAIDAAGRERGRIQLRIGPADPEFLLPAHRRPARAAGLFRCRPRPRRAVVWLARQASYAGSIPAARLIDSAAAVADAIAVSV